jgi:uncharacterized membrane protein
MNNTRLPSSIFFLLALLGGAQYLYYAPRLPEIVASHFGAAGSANGWQTKMVFFSMELGVIALATVVAFGVPRMIEALPVAMINLPHKDFLLSAERRTETFSYLRAWTLWFGCGLLAFLLFVMGLVFRANLQTPPRLDMGAFLPALIAFVVFDAIALVRMILHFSKLQAD